MLIYRRSFVIALALAAAIGKSGAAQALYTLPAGEHSRLATPENPTGARGHGGILNQGAKGRAFVSIPAHVSVELLNVSGAGIVDRIKFTLKDRSPQMLRSLRIEAYWDNASKPAISVPVGDFFGTAFGQTSVYDTNLFTNPEGRSFAIAVPMPYRTAARIALTNDSDVDQPEIFYEVSFRTLSHPPSKMLYFHAFWRREMPDVGKDFTILPELYGNGRYLGVSIGIHANPAYTLKSPSGDPQTFWWGEGEVKMFLDGDTDKPTMVGTGAEDYFGTAWGMQHFINQNSGCTIADQSTLHWSCYRLHLPDPIYFHKNLRVTIQQIGGGPLKEVREMAAAGAPLRAISVDATARFYPLFDMKDPPKLMDSDFPDGWTNYFRSDDWCATSYFYLDQPASNLPTLPPVSERIKDL